MRLLYIFCLVSCYVLHESISAEQLDFSTDENDSNASDICRKRRDADDEDVVNRFEMERVSPLFEIVRHLPPFEDNWLSSPVTIPTFPSFPSIKLENESSSYDEYKIEVIKDEEHVIGESGKQFKENSALNWYYSAESYSSVNNFTSKNKDLPKPQINAYSPTIKTDTIVTDTIVTETAIPKTSILRKQDDEHVVSHVPSLKEGRGTFLDFNLLGSATTPKFDSTIPPKNEEVKPNITTRYFLLQSGRVVAINVTSVTPVLKPTSNSGQVNKNPLLPTFYFGSRIKNNNVHKSTNITNQQNPGTITTSKSVEQKQTKQINQRNSLSTHSEKNNQLNVPRIENSQFHNRSDSNLESVRKSTKNVTTPVTIKPNIEFFSPQKKSFTPTVPHFTITPHVVYSKLKENSFTNKSQTLKQLPVTAKYQQSAEISSTKLPLHGTTENSTLDPAQKWWSEMKAAKRERLSFTTQKPKFTAKVLKTVNTAVTDPFYSKSFDSMKTSSKELITPSTFELTGNARSAKLRMTEGQALHFSTTPSSAKLIRAPNPLNTPRWSTFAPSVEIRGKIDETSTKRSDEDLLQPSVPLSDVRHDFVRIVSLPPPLSSGPSFKPSTTTLKPVKENPGSSRRPRYRGLSHVNLQAPKPQRIETSTGSPKQEINTFPSNYQLTTNPYKKAVNYQWWNPESTTFTNPPNVQVLTTPLARKSRPAFHLRNSASFQTIPPGSLTDRRTLTSETPNYDVTVIDSLQPPLSDLLIISFEPTRKSMGPKETKNKENISQKQEKKNSQRGTAKTTKRPSALIRDQEKHLLTTAKPLRIHVQTPLQNIRSADQAPVTPRSGNREGRHYRTNNQRLLNIAAAEKSSTASPDMSTTKQPFRMYYFEPKRRRSKEPNVEPKNETAKLVSSTTKKPFRGNVQRASLVNRETEIPRSRGVQSNNRSTNTRRAKYLQETAKDINPATDQPTTPKPSNQRHRSSPFIWHRPNVGTVKSTP